MTQQEFQERVQMTVTIKEYEHIEAIYMESDLYKDEFCKLWVKMNLSRVKAAKETAKKEAAQQEICECLWHIIKKYNNKQWEWKNQTLVMDALSSREIKSIEKAGMSIKEWNNNYGDYMFKRMSTILYDIRKYLKAA